MRSRDESHMQVSSLCAYFTCTPSLLSYIAVPIATDCRDLTSVCVRHPILVGGMNCVVDQKPTEVTHEHEEMLPLHNVFSHGTRSA